jgi:transcriptional regulator with XRE-family HTH domain
LQPARANVATVLKEHDPLPIIEQQRGQPCRRYTASFTEGAEERQEMIYSEHGEIMGEMYRTCQRSISRLLEMHGAGSIPRMDNQEIRERIAKRLEETGKSARAASLDAGMSADAIRDIFRKQDSSPTIETLRKLAIGLGTTPEWLIFGSEALGSFGGRLPSLKAAASEPVSDASLISERMVAIPLVGDVEAGAFREAPEFESDDIEYMMDYPDREYPHARHIGFRVRGDSMNDLKPRSILEGDKVIGLDFQDIEGQIVLREGMIVVVEQTRDGGHTREWSVKQMEIYEDRYEFCPRSTSKRHKPIVVPNKVFHDPSEDDGRQVRILALVRRIISDVTY